MCGCGRRQRRCGGRSIRPGRPVTRSGGAFEVIAHGVPPGLGSYVQWDRKLDGRLAQAFMSIPAIKAVGIGRAAESAALPGSRMHDEIVLAESGAAGTSARREPADEQRRRARRRRDQRRRRPHHCLDEADLHADETASLGRSRHDDRAPPQRSSAATCAPCRRRRWWAKPMVCLVLADALLEKFGGDTVAELDAAWRATHAHRLRDRLTRRPEPA